MDQRRPTPVSTFLWALLAFWLLVSAFAYLSRGVGATTVILVYLLMFTPLAAALVARAICRMPFVFGKFTWVTVIGMVVPVGAVVLGFLVASAFGVVTATASINPTFVIVILIVSTLLAVGEEFGWRGFLLPHLRQKYRFWRSNLIVAGAWLALRLPIIFFGIYGTKDMAFPMAVIGYSVNIVLLSLVIGTFWELHNDVWAPTITHGAWNVVVTTVLPTIYAGSTPWLLSEFGLLAAIPLAIVLIVMLVVLRRRGLVGGSVD